MRLIPDKYRVLIWIGLVLALGFLGAGAAVLVTSRDAAQRSLTEQTLPLAGDALVSGIHAQVERAVLLASMTAGDSFMRDWLAAGDDDAVVRRLAGMRRDLGADAFLAAARTGSYYSAQGVSTIEREGGSALLRARDSRLPYIAEAFIERKDGNAMTVVVHHRIVESDGRFLGVAGVAMSVRNLAAIIDRHGHQPGRRVYLVNSDRRIVFASGAMALPNRSIDQLPGLGGIAGQLLQAGNPVVLDYVHEGAHTFATGHGIPDIGWHVVVEQDAAAAGSNAFAVVLAAGAGTTLSVIMLVLLMVRRYEARLARIAGSDALTGLLNRPAFEIVFRQAMLEAERSGHPLSCILFDVDLFRQVNETHGHAAGDDVLRSVARITRALLRESDMIARWGGEEFVVLLKECTLEQAVSVAEKLRGEIDRYDYSRIGPDLHVTISLGVARHLEGETAGRFLHRADEALHKAKANGRNRLQVARAGAMEGRAAESAS